MGHHSRTLLILLPVLVASLFLAGCPEKSPELVVAEQRAKYTVKLNTFMAKEPEPAETMEVMEGEMAAAAEEAAVAEEAEMVEEGAEGEGEEEMAEPEGPSSTTVFFDLLVNYDGRDAPLPGITVDISHADPFEKEKGAYKHWIDTSGMVRGQMTQFDFELDVPDFETGDVFSVDLRSNIPPEEFGDYREFATAP